MVCKLAVEVLVMWVCYAAYMAILVHRRGPLGGIFFYPKAVQERVMELGLVTQDELGHRRRFAYTLMAAWMFLVPLAMIVLVNGARSYGDCCWQYYVLFVGAEFFDWLVIDTIWVALSDWWLIPGAEDLEDTWHTTRAKRWKLLALLPASIPVAAFAGALCWLVALIA